MKTTTICLLALCCIASGLPNAALAGAQPVSASEMAQLSLLSKPGLLRQSAGDKVIVIQERGPRWGRGYGIPIAAVILTAVIITLVVVGVQPRVHR